MKTRGYFIDKLKRGEDFIFVKLGDGELICMLGSGDINGGMNIDGSHYFLALSDTLKESYRSLLKKKAYLGNKFNSTAYEVEEEFYKLMLRDYEAYLVPEIPELENYDMKAEGNLFLHQKGALTEELYDLYATIRNSERRKIFIGPRKLFVVSSLLNAEFIEVPGVDAFLSIDDVTHRQYNNCIVMVSAGIASKVIINDISNKASNVTLIDLGSAFDPLIEISRTNQPSVLEMRAFYKDFLAAIPKKIWTVWLSENGIVPDLIQKCIESQKIPGYEHTIITLENCFKGYPYIQQALEAKKWVKATDFLRMFYLYTYGGIFLDADVEVLPGKNFDNLLGNVAFAAREKNGFIGAAVIGSMPNYEFIRLWIEEVVQNFRGDDDKNFESSMDILVRGYFEKDWPKEGFALLPTEMLYPYDHQDGSVNITDQTICYHHFYKSWVDPIVSIVVPTLGREDGLKKLLESVSALNYPKQCIQLVVKKGLKSVPKKLKEALPECIGEYICFMANDTEFTPDSLKIALRYAKDNDKALVAFNAGDVLPDEGNICEHFIIRKDFVPLIGGEIFCTRMNHVGVDNLLWAKASKLGQAARCNEAIIIHKHFSNGGNVWDKVYEKGWSKTSKDREILKEELAKL